MITTITDQDVMEVVSDYEQYSLPLDIGPEIHTNISIIGVFAASPVSTLHSMLLTCDRNKSA